MSTPMAPARWPWQPEASAPAVSARRSLRAGCGPGAARAALALYLAIPLVAAAVPGPAHAAASGGAVFVDRGWSLAADGDVVAAGRVAGLNAFSTIQAAVDAAPPGGTVNVAAGTYVEQVIVSGKNLTLAGAGAGLTVIMSPGLLPAAFTAGGFVNKAVLLCRDAPDIRVRDLTVDGAGQGDVNIRFIGLAYFNAGGLASQVKVLGVRNSPIDNVQHGFGVYCQNTGGGPYSLELDHVEVSDFQKTGMLLNGAGMIVDVHDCTITGSGDLGVIAQNGIQLGSGAGGSIRDCSLTDLRFLPAIAVSGAVLVYQPGAPVTLSGFTGANAFSNVQAPIRWYDGNGWIDGVEVVGPVIEMVDFGPISISNFSGPGEPFAAGPAALPGGPPPVVPIVEPVASAAGGLGALQVMSAKSVDIRNLCLSGSDVPGTTGLYLYSTGGPLNVTVSGAVLHDWDYGIRIIGAATSLDVSNSSIASNVTAGLDNDGGSPQIAKSNWWGDPSGPSGTGPGAGDVIIGPSVDVSAWLLSGTNAATGCGFSAAPEQVGVTTDAPCISLETTCVTFDVSITRTTMTTMRGFSVPVQLSSNLQLCTGPESIVEGDYLSASGPTYFKIIEQGGGAYTVDGVILGAACAAAPAGTLFTLQVSRAPGPDGIGTVTIGTPVLRDCDNGPLAGAAGPPYSITIDTSGLPECGLSGLPEHIDVTTADTLISTVDSCATFDVTISRTTATAVRGFSVPVQLSPNLQLCTGPASIVEGEYLSDAGTTFFTVTDEGGGEYTVDGVILGAPCGATAISGPLFRLQVTYVPGPDGTGTVTIGPPILRDCENLVVSSEVGAPASIVIDATGPSTVGDLTATQVLSGNDADGSTRILVSFTTPGDAASVEVYRAGFGGYPAYDDAPGAGVPALPAYPPGPPWTLTPVTAPGQTDEVAQRDFWYYVAFARDAVGNASAVSNRTAGTLNYHLGDVSDGLVAGAGNNVVLAEDVSLLGSHYPALLGVGDSLGFLDVGPTTDRSASARPVTDFRVDFEDLIVFALNYGVVSGPLEATGATPAERNVLALEVPAPPATGAMFDAALRFAGRGNVRGLSLALVWNRSVVEPVGVAGGGLLDGQSGEAIVLPAGPGALDIALLGAGGGIAGTGVLARVTFRVIGSGDPGIALERVIARDGENRTVSLEEEVDAVPAPELPARTALGVVSPNPSSGTTRIEFSLAGRGRAELTLFDLSGRRVRTLLDGPLEAGVHRIGWDGRGPDGGRVAPGFYVLRLEAGGTTTTRRITIVR